MQGRAGMRTLPDRTHVHAIHCSRPEGDIYVWDRISEEYNGPAVASNDPSFAKYSTLDSDNAALLENTYSQLSLIWKANPSKEESELLRKLKHAIFEYTSD